MFHIIHKLAKNLSPAQVKNPTQKGVKILGSTPTLLHI